jgi:hypothetical protein
MSKRSDAQALFATLPAAAQVIVWIGVFLTAAVPVFVAVTPLALLLGFSFRYVLAAAWLAGIATVVGVWLEMP